MLTAAWKQLMKQLMSVLSVCQILLLHMLLTLTQIAEGLREHDIFCKH